MGMATNSMSGTAPPLSFFFQGADKNGTAPGNMSYLEAADTAEKNIAELKALLK